MHKSLNMSAMKSKLLCMLQISLLIIAYSSCKGTGKTQSGHKGSTAIIEYNVVKYSPHTRSFLNHVEKAIAMKGEFTPDEEFLGEYTINESDGIYYVGGIIKVSPGTDVSIFNYAGVKISSQVGENWSARIPVKNLHLIGDLEQVLYVEISKKLTPKN